MTAPTAPTTIRPAATDDHLAPVRLAALDSTTGPAALSVDSTTGSAALSVVPEAGGKLSA